MCAMDDLDALLREETFFADDPPPPGAAEAAVPPADPGPLTQEALVDELCEPSDAAGDLELITGEGSASPSVSQVASGETLWGLAR